MALRNNFSDQKVPYYQVCYYGLLNSQAGGTKLERFLPKNQYTQMKLLNFENWCSVEVSKSDKIAFQSQFSVSKIIQIIFTKISILQAHFLLLPFFGNINF